MKTIKMLAVAAIATLCSVAFTSCGDDDKEVSITYTTTVVGLSDAIPAEQQTVLKNTFNSSTTLTMSTTDEAATKVLEYTSNLVTKMQTVQRQYPSLHNTEVGVNITASGSLNKDYGATYFKDIPLDTTEE